MFQLIVAVISIALVAALAIASIFYGGEAFSKSSEKANVTALVNAAQQISGAYTLYRTDWSNTSVVIGDSSTAGSLVALKYLASAPAPSKVATGSWTITGGVARIGLVGSPANTAPVCQEVNRQSGNTVTADIEAGTFLSNAQFVCNAGNFEFKL